VTQPFFYVVFIKRVLGFSRFEYQIYIAVFEQLYLRNLLEERVANVARGFLYRLERFQIYCVFLFGVYAYERQVVIPPRRG
jgi:hypothetical protein